VRRVLENGPLEHYETNTHIKVLTKIEQLKYRFGLDLALSAQRSAHTLKPQED
jgi:hypothetical protein